MRQYVRSAINLCVSLKALDGLRDHVEEIPTVVGGKEVYTGKIKEQVSVSLCIETCKSTICLSTSNQIKIKIKEKVCTRKSNRGISIGNLHRHIPLSCILHIALY